MALTESELQGLRALYLTPQGKHYVAMLKDKLAEADARLRRLSGEHLTREQGRAQQLEELIGDLTNAEQGLKRTDQSRRPIVWNQA